MDLKHRLLTGIFAFLFSLVSFSQILEPVTWKHSIEQISDNDYEITFTASIDNGWYVYSQEEPEGIGPIPTLFTFNNQEGNYKLLGETTEPKVEPKFDKVFELDLKKFQGEADFKQRITVLNPDLNLIEVVVDYQTCNDEKCIPGDFTFRITLDGSEIEVEEATVDERSKLMSKALELNIKGLDKYQAKTEEEQSYFSIFLLGFLGGLIALLTP